MARILKAASVTEAVQAHRQKPIAAESGRHNETRKGRQSKLADPVMPAPAPGRAAAAPGRRTARLSKAMGQPVSTPKNAESTKTPQRRKSLAATPATEASAARVAAPSPHAVEAHQPFAAAQPAAQWDHATDTIRFDWPAIEQMASRDGPHQGTAKLLIAARAQGANSRWPL